MNNCTIQLWYNKQRVKKNGTVSLYLQVISERESSEVPLKLNWPVDKFDWNKKVLKERYPGDPDLLTFNAAIERERAKYWKAVMDFIADDKAFTMADLFRRVNLDSKGEKFCAFFEHAIRARQTTKVERDRIKEITAKPFKSTLKWMKGFIGDADMPIMSVDRRWMERFANYLRDHMVENSVWAHIKAIKSMLSYAARNDIRVNPDHKKYTITMEDTDPTWLEEDELNRLLDLYRDEYLHPEPKRYLKAFLFACFTGLRISDLVRWNKSWIQGDFISFVPQKRRLSKKTPKPLLIPIIPIARHFIDELAGETFEIKSDVIYNKELKHIAKMADITTKNLTSHVARHTFATWLAIDEVPLIVVSKLLGHRSTKTTMIYIHIAEKYKAIQLMKMQRRFGLNKPAKTVS